VDERDRLADRFEADRTHLRAVAYRMLGSVSEADDAVQEAWLRLSRSQGADVENLRAWLTTVVARVSLDMLRSRKSRREEPLGAHVPEPIVSREDGTDPTARTWCWRQSTERRSSRRTSSPHFCFPVRTKP
jgi:DNA-directed RNA polymerase specialized sigma24 family protein